MTLQFPLRTCSGAVVIVPRDPFQLHTFSLVFGQHQVLGRVWDVWKPSQCGTLIIERKKRKTTEQQQKETRSENDFMATSQLAEDVKGAALRLIPLSCFFTLKLSKSAFSQISCDDATCTCGRPPFGGSPNTRSVAEASSKSTGVLATQV